MDLSRVQRVVFEICLAPMVDEFVVNMEVHVNMMELPISFSLDVELRDPVVGQVLGHVACGALAALQGIVLSELVKPAPPHNSMDMPSRLNTWEHDGVHTLGGQHSAVYSPHIGLHGGQMNEKTKNC